MFFRIKILIFVLLNCVLLNAGMVGGYAGSELRYGSNAREFSLGGALIALSNPGFRQFSNPALISTVKKTEFGLSLFSMSLDRSIQSFAYNRHLPPKAGLGIAMFRSGTSNIEGRNTIGEITEIFTYFDLMGILSFGVQFTEKISLGLNLKISSSNILDEINNNSISIDAGALYRLSNKINFGMRITNLIGKYKWKYDLVDTEKNYSIFIPKLISMGSKYSLNEKTVFVSQLDVSILPIVKDNIGYNTGVFHNNETIEWVIPDKGLIYRLGIEKEFFNDSKLRMGINSDKITLGLGACILIWEKYNLSWDYSLDPGVMEEGISHNFSWRIEL